MKDVEFWGLITHRYSRGKIRRADFDQESQEIVQDQDTGLRKG